MDKRILMVLLGALLTACTSGPVRVHGADFSVDDAHIRVTDGYYRYHGGHYYRYYDDHHHHDGYYRRYYDDRYPLTIPSYERGVARLLRYDRHP